MIPFLNHHKIEFPELSTALDEPNGLIAAGGNLSAETLLKAYHLGIFPWFSAPDPILWWSPSPRSVLKPHEIHISKSMRKILKKNLFTISCDKAFKEVMQGCAGVRNYTDSTWISKDIIQGYTQLNKLGYAHSIEVWKEETLVGGLYGVAIGCVFFGESMFSTASNASKIGFILLTKTLEECGFELIDCQVASNHLNSLGAKNISREEFQLLLKTLTKKAPNTSPWTMLNNRATMKNKEHFYD